MTYLPEPFKVYAACGKAPEPPVEPVEAGLFDVPVRFPNGMTMMIAVNEDGEYAAGALIEQGGDRQRARWDLSVAAGLVTAKS